MRGDVAAKGTGIVHAKGCVLTDSSIKANANHAHAGKFLTLDVSRTGITHGNLGSGLLVAKELRVSNISTNLHGYATGRKRQSTANADIDHAEILIVNFGLDIMLAGTFREVVGCDLQPRQTDIGFNLISIRIESLPASFAENLEDIGVVVMGLGRYNR